MFEGRKMLVATKHRKEVVLKPMFENALGVHCVVPEIDTDCFGTFSGEMERKDDPLTTAKKKCLLAMDAYACDMAVSSEGSFGLHPQLFFAYADEEILMFIDRKNNLEIHAREISADTNFSGKEIHGENDLLEFALAARFPSHALILKGMNGTKVEFKKDIVTHDGLMHAYRQLLETHENVYVETDMRAHCNPSRMKVIEKAAAKLLKTIQSECPDCSTPGFGITDARKGLPCGRCGAKTQGILSYIHACRHCGFEKEEFHPHKKESQDPMFCDFCNP
jgi:hypothetical protein